MTRARRLLVPAGLLCLALAVSPAIAQEATPEAANIRSGARVANPPSGQHVSVTVRRAFLEPRGHNLNRRYRGRVSSHPLERNLRTGQRRLEHCIDSAPHPALELSPDLNGSTVIRARIVIAGRQITSVTMSDSPISPVVEACLRAGFQQTRGHLPRSGRVIAVFYMRPRPAS